MSSDRPPDDSRARLLHELERVRRRFAGQLPAKVEAIESSWQRLRGGGWETAEATALQRAAHALAGTAGSLGFERVAAAARSLEVLVEAVLELAGEPSREQSDQIVALLDVLSGEATDPVASSADDFALPEVEERPQDTGTRIVLALTDDEVLVGEVASHLGHFGYDVRVATGEEQLVESARRETPFAILADLEVAGDPLAGARAVRRLREETASDVPVVFVSARGDVEARLEAVRAGCLAYFTRPMETSSLVETLESLDHRRVSTWRVLVVDDDPAVAAFYGHTLRYAGFDTEEVTDPLEVPRRMVEFQPDLILMDVYMPSCSGVELAAVIRQEEAFAGIPIVFLSGERNPMRQIFAIDQGGDDFFTKPVDPDQLVAAVAARAKRGRVLRSLLQRDGLTGLLGHSHVLEHLELAVATVRRREGSLTAAMIDVDHFKEINDEHGHLVGDQVLKSLAFLLRSRLRATDVLGRYGGDEYLVILPDTGAAAAMALLDEIRRKFSSMEHRAAGRDAFRATVSCGVAEFGGGGAEALVHAADRALYAAKRAGRNRVELASTEGPRAPAEVGS